MINTIKTWAMLRYLRLYGKYSNIPGQVAFDFLSFDWLILGLFSGLSALFLFPPCSYVFLPNTSKHQYYNFKNIFQIKFHLFKKTKKNWHVSKNDISH